MTDASEDSLGDGKVAEAQDDVRVAGRCSHADFGRARRSGRGLEALFSPPAIPSAHDTTADVLANPDRLLQVRASARDILEGPLGGKLGFDVALERRGDYGYEVFLLARLPILLRSEQQLVLLDLVARIETSEPDVSAG